MSTTVAAPATTLPKCPYKGVMPYGEEDAEFFFGREAWRDIIVDNLKAYRLTLLYGESGVGKSSVLRAGVAHRLRKEARRNAESNGTPELAVVVFSSWREEPAAGLARCIDKAVANLVGEAAAEEAPQDLESAIERAAERIGGRLFVILDQFEEYFLYHPASAGEEAFADAFARAVGRPDLRVTFLVSIREDALARLDRFKGRIWNLFDNYLRIEHLDEEAAREAIEQPIERFNALAPDDAPFEIGKGLVDAVVHEIGAGKIQGGAAAGASPASQTDGSGGIETPYLQLVMTRLWEEERKAESRVLRLETLMGLGGAAGIVETHLDAAMNTLPPDEQDVAAKVFRYLVTRGRTKIAHEVTDLADWAAVDERKLRLVLEKLAGSETRILRPASESSFEIYHDVLADAVVSWRTRHEAVQKVEAERRESDARMRKRLRRIAILAGGLALALAVALALLAFNERDRANRLAKLATSREFAATATAQLNLDPGASLDHAKAAFETWPTDQATAALRKALSASPVRAVLHGHSGPVRAAVFSHDGRLVATAGDDDTARLWRVATGTQLGVVHPGGERVVRVAFSRDDKVVATLGGDSSVRLWDTATRKPLGELRPAKRYRLRDGYVPHPSLSFSRDGTLLLTAGPDAAARIWNLATKHERVLLGRRRSLVDSAVFNPSGTKVLTASDDQDATLWSARTGRKIAVLHERDQIAQASFSPDGNLVVTATVASGPGPGHIWTVRGRKIVPLPGRAPLWSASFSPDGKRVLMVRYHGAAYMWDTSTAQLVPLPGRVTSAAFSPDGTRVVGTTGTGRAWIWRAADGKRLAVLSGHGKKIFNAAFSPDGKLLVTAGADGTARIWTTQNGKPLFVARGPRHADTVDASFSPGGTTASIVDATGTGRVLATADGAPFDIPRKDRSGRDDTISSVTLTGDGKLIAARSSSGTLRVLTRSGRQIAALPASEGVVDDDAFSPSGHRLLIAMRDGRALVWNPGSGRVISLPGGARIYQVRWSADGRTALGGGEDGKLHVWNTTTWRTIGVLPAPGGLVSPDGRYELTTRGGEVFLWNLRTRRRIRLGRVRFATAAAFGPDGRKIVVASDDGRVYTWTTGSRRSHRVVLTQRHGGFVRIQLSPDGTRAMIVGRRATEWLTATGRKIGSFPVPRFFRSFDEAEFSADAQEIVLVAGGSAYVLGADRRPIATLVGSDRRVLQIATSADGEVVVAVRANGTATVFNFVTNTDTLLRRRGGIYEAAVSQDGGRIITTGENTATVWDSSSGHLTQEQRSSVGAISSDGKRFLTAHAGQLRVWDAENGKLVGKIRQDWTVRAAAFSPDSKRVVLAGFGLARVWEIGKKHAVALSVPNVDIRSPGFSPDGRFVVTADAEGKSRVWEADTGRAVAALAPGEPLRAAAFLGDSRHIATVAEHGSLRIYECAACATGDELRALAEARS